MSSPATTPPLVTPLLPSPDETFGVLLVAFMISTPLYGIVCYQAWQYYTRSGSSDSAFLKTIVTIVFLLETSTQCFNSHVLYYYLINKQADVRALSTIIWSLAAPAGTTGIEGTIIQLFFGHKVYIMSGRNKPLFGTIILLATASLGRRDPRDTFPFNEKRPTRRREGVHPPLFRHDRRCRYHDNPLSEFLLISGRREQQDRTKNVLNRIILLTVNNGIFVSATALGAFVTKIASSSLMLPFAFTFLLSKAYTNMFLSSLNSRHASREILEMPRYLTTSSSGRSRPTSYGLPTVPIKVFAHESQYTDDTRSMRTYRPRKESVGYTQDDREITGTAV
ncbi:hypothetical protein BDZ89DRAFT_1165811 [Hymenopellis radicata]|nr:hypothetical protein BDZ89DRAFT_1165811 [Hymenopellis radicata]